MAKSQETYSRLSALVLPSHRGPSSLLKKSILGGRTPKSPRKIRADQRQDPFFNGLLETWVERYAPKHWISSWNAAVDAGFFYDNARVELKPELRKKMDKFLRPFLGTSTSKTHRRHVRDLTGGNTEEGLFEITMSPAKVAEFCAKADFDWVEKLRPLWDEHNEMDFDPDFTHMKNFGCFKRYMGQWQKLLQTAVRKKKGLVISIV